MEDTFYTPATREEATRKHGKRLEPAGRKSGNVRWSANGGDAWRRCRDTSERRNADETSRLPLRHQ
jgi:hypothetical protein